ncbi:MAG TPA: GNAT family N-acetyltransferase [Solirubrobacteraceae bacterium]|nr:GNAT family N-acetyltransferase [Solirubrobacteraceae bacterium]
MSAPAPGAVRVRAAQPRDVETIYGFIVELAEYERAPEQVVGTPALLHEALFGQRPSCEGLVAEREGAVVGFAIFHGTFSTWECRAGLWLEDLYVPVAARRHGVGRALLGALAAIAVQRGCPRLEWHALDWNEPALRFYEQLGAQRLSEWELHRLSGEALRRVAAG